MHIALRRSDTIREWSASKKLRDIDRIEGVALIAKFTVDFNVGALGQNALDFVAAQHAQHAADFFTRTGALEACEIGRAHV